MAEIQWGLLKQPDYLGGALQAQTAGRQQAGVNALRGYQTDPQAAIQGVLASGDIQGAQRLTELNQSQVNRSAGQAAAEALAAGDAPGAMAAYAPTGDIQGVGALSDHIIRQKQAQLAYTTDEATKLFNLYQTSGGDQNPQARDVVLQAFDAAAPNYKTMAGATDESLAQLRAGLAQNPGTALRALANPPKISFHTAGDTLFATNDDTGQKVGAWTGQKFQTLNNPDGGQSLVSVGGDAGAPGAAGAAPSAGGASTPAPTGGVYDQVGKIAQQNGAKPDEVAYLQRLAQVESNGKPDAQNGSSTGVFQFHPDTFAGLGGKDIHSVPQQTFAALALQRRDRQNLQQLGIQPTDANVYIMHQQGAGGGRALLTADPGASAVDVLTPVYGNAAVAKKAIVGNGGSPDMTAGQFVSMWQKKWANSDHVDDGGQPNSTAEVAPGVHVIYNTSGNISPDSQLSDDAIHLLAGRYLKDGTLPPLGMGKQASMVRQKILNDATNIAKGMGLDAGDLVAGTMDTKAAGAALSKQTQTLAAVQSFEGTALKNADLMLGLAPKGGGQTNVPVLNRWLQAGRKQVQGDADVTNFDIALGTFADEYAKIVSGSTGGQGSTDSARAEAYSRLNKYATQGQLAGGVATMKKEMHNRILSMEDVNEGLRSKLRSGGSAPAVQINSPSPEPSSGRPPLSSFSR